jgi:hypothetical protein
MKEITALQKKLKLAGVKGFKDEGSKLRGAGSSSNEEVLMKLYQDHFQTEGDGGSDAKQLQTINTKLTYMLNLMYDNGMNRLEGGGRKRIVDDDKTAG